MNFGRFLSGVMLVGLSACRRAPQPQAETPAAKPVAAAPEQAQAPSATPQAPTCPSWESLDRVQLVPAPVSLPARVLEAIWDKVRLRHFDPTLNCLDWVTLRAEYLKKVQALSSQDQVYALYNELLAKLGQSHLVAIPPSPLFKEIEPNQGPAHPLAYWTWLGDQLFLRAPRPGEDKPATAHQSGEVTRIDGVPVATLFSTSKGSEGSAHFNSMERGLRTQRFLSCSDKGDKRLELRRKGGVTTNVRIPCVRRSGQSLSLGKLRNIQAEVRAELIDPRAKVGYLAFNVWMLPMLPKIREAMSRLQAQGMKSLILDLRGNRGGVASMTIPVARLLWPAGGSLGSIIMRSFRQELSVRPNPKAFGGEIVLLLDDQSASTTEIFALGLSGAGRAKIVAAGPSAGMALASIIEGLPDGGLLQYVIGRYESPTRKVAEGRGVAPDRLVPYTEMHLHERRDPVLKAALESLRN